MHAIKSGFIIPCTFNAAPTCVDATLPCYQRLYQRPANRNALVFFTRLIRSLYLLLYPLDAIPLPFQVLLPQADLVVASTDSQHVSTQTPTYPPQYSVELQNRRFPLVRMCGVTCPYPDCLILRRGRYVRLLQDCGSPGDVPDPVRVAGEFLDGSVAFVLCTAQVLSAR